MENGFRSILALSILLCSSFRLAMDMLNQAKFMISSVRIFGNKQASMVSF